MSVAEVLPLRPSTLNESLDRQRRQGVDSSRLVLTATTEDTDAGGLPVELDGSLTLSTLDVDAEETREALRHAIENLGVREIVVLTYSDCRHLPVDKRPGALARKLRGFAGMRARAAASPDRVRVASELARWASRELSATPELATVVNESGTEVAGLVMIVEAGTFLAYDPQLDTFHALVDAKEGL